MAQLVGHRAREVEIGLLVRGPPVGAHAELWKGGDLPRKLLRRGARRPAGDHAVRQPHLQGLLRLHRTAGENQVERPREPVSLLVVGSKRGTPSGRVTVSAAVEYLIEIGTSPVLVVPRGVTLPFGLTAALSA